MQVLGCGVVLIMTTVFVYMYSIIDSMHREQQALRLQLAQLTGGSGLQLNGHRTLGGRPPADAAPTERRERALEDASGSGCCPCTLDMNDSSGANGTNDSAGTAVGNGSPAGNGASDSHGAKQSGTGSVVANGSDATMSSNSAAGDWTSQNNGANRSDETACVDGLVYGVYRWADSNYRRCDVYREQQFCSPAGGLGPGWNPSWGTFADVRAYNGKTAWMVCCGCRPTALDSGGDGCSYYDRNPGHCGCCDDDDFVAGDLCGACVPEILAPAPSQARQLSDAIRGWPKKTTRIVFAEGVEGELGAVEWPARFPMLRVVELRTLTVPRGGITGTLPTALSLLHTLEELRLPSQQLLGTVPPELGELPRLRVLDLSDNKFEGTIPAALFRLPSLQNLSLASNRLTGTIPSPLAPLSPLQVLHLDDNQLMGTIPPELGSLTGLKALWLGGNRLQGTIPTQLWGLPDLAELGLGSNQLEGTIPAEVGQAAALERLELAGNSLLGTLPAELSRLARLQYLLLGENLFSGPLPLELRELHNLVDLSLSGNQLTGTLPPQWGELAALQKLDLSHNQLQGLLPAELGNLSVLQQLYLSHNQINGTIPPGLGSLHELGTLELQDNLLEGAIPEEVSGLAVVKVFRVRNNRLSGTVPAGLFGNPQTEVVDLANNHLEGTLPQAVVMESLLSLDVSTNALLGGLLPDLHTCDKLLDIFARGCSFTGFGRPPTNIQRLDFSGNRITALPGSWFKLWGLVEMDLSNNMIQRFPRAQVWPQALFQNLDTGSVNCVEYMRTTKSPVLGEVKMSWDRLQKLDLSGNPLGLTTPLWDLLYTLSGAEDLLELRLSGCKLRGRMPQAGAFAYSIAPNKQDYCKGTFSNEISSPAFLALRVLDLSNNSIEALLSAPPSQLTLAHLHSNSLAGAGLHPRWFQDPSSLEIWGNPLLRVDVQVPQAPCPPLGSVGLQANLFAWSPQGNALYECTSLCSGLKTRYAVDPTLNVSSLCRCRAGTGGAGMNCTSCPADTYSVEEDPAGMLRTCRPCPTGSSTGGRINTTSVAGCTCPADWYMPSLSQGGGEVTACVRCTQWPFRTTTFAGATRDDQCQCSPEYEGLRAVLGVCGCQDGQYLDAASKKCVPCTETEDCNWGFQVNKSLGPPRQKEYPMCEAGSFNARNGTLSCTRCDRGTFAAKVGSTECQPCPDGLTTVDVGSSGLEFCVCRPGGYRALPSGRSDADPSPCEPCPQGMRCAVGSDVRHVTKGDGEYPKAEEGFMTRVGDALAVYRCLDPHSCPGGPPGTCGDLRDPDAIACGLCRRHAFESSDGRCLPCGELRNGQLLLAFMIVLAAAVVVAVTLAANREAAAQPRSTTACFIVLGVAFTTAQSLSVFQSMQVQWFEPLNTAFAVLKAVSFDLRWLRISCLVGAQPAAIFAPRQFIAPAAIPLIAATLRVKRWWAPHMHLVRELRNTVGTVFSLFFISIVTSAATPFICYEHPKGQGSSMRSAPSVLCNFRAEHAQMVATGLSALAIVPLPFLAVCIWATLSYPRLVASTSDQQAQTLRAYRFLFFRYQPHAYYFGLVQLARSLAVCFIPVLVLDPAVQVCAMGFLLLVFMSAQLRVQPWRGELTNSIDGCSSMMMLLLLLCTGMVTDLRAQLASVQVIGALAFFGFAASVVLYLLLILYRRLRVHPFYHVFLCHHKADAAAQARLLDLLLEAKSGGRISVFIDSDDLQELDRLFDVVRSRVARLVVYLTRHTLTRPWCAGEVVTAALHSRCARVTRVETPSWAAPSAAELANIASYVDQTGLSLAEYGISWEDVVNAFKILLSDATPCVEMATDGGSLRFESLAEHLLHFGGSSASIGGADNVTDWRCTPDAVLLSSDPFDDEATASVSIFQHQAQPLLLASLATGMVRLGDHADADPEWLLGLVAQARAVLVFLSKRSLQCVPQLAVIVEVMLRIGAGGPGTVVVPVSLPHFEFPGDDYYRLELPILLQIDAQVARETVSNFFKRIALPLVTSATRSIIEVQARRIAGRVPQARPGHEADTARNLSLNTVRETCSQRLMDSLNDWRAN